jgi:N-formylglutamate deformylase
MILNIPHSSREIPADLLNQFVLSEEEIAWELNRMTDSFTDELFFYGEVTQIIYPISRLVVDPERFLDDVQEPMSSVGMGVIYARTSAGKILRKVISNEKESELINRFYFPYQEKLTRAVKNELETTKRCLIIDCHSFPAVPLPYEFDKSSDRPDICIGTDKFHTPIWLIEIVEKLLGQSGFKIKKNSPFSGSMVPQTYYQVNENVYSIMLEVNRNLYMDEEKSIKSPDFKEVQGKINKILSFLSTEFPG